MMTDPVSGVKDICKSVNIHRWRIRNDMDMGYYSNSLDWLKE